MVRRDKSSSGNELKETIVDEEYIESMNKYREKGSGGLIESCSKDIINFSRYMLGFTLYSWQVEFLHSIQESLENNESDKEFVALTSRQIGKSTALAIFALWTSLFNKYPGTLHNNTTVGIISASDAQATKLLREIKKFIFLGDTFMKTNYNYDIDFFSHLLSTKDPNNTTTVTFRSYRKDLHGDYLLKDSKSGSFIKSYPPTAVVLGETFSIVMIDEAGKSDRISDVFFYDYIYPTGNSTNALRIYTSTPWTPQGFFYKMCDPHGLYPINDVKKFVFTADAIRIENPTQYKTVMKVIDNLNADGNTDAVQRAYYCRFIKGSQSYFNPDNVFKIFSDNELKFESFERECDMGIDFGGQVSSRTVITISYLDDDGIIHRLYDKVYDVGKDLDLIDDVEQLLKEFNIQRIIPDDCPAGDFLIRTMKEEKGWNVFPMSFRKDKVKKYGAFRKSLNKGKVFSYYDEDLMTEMMSLENSNTSRQSVIISPPGYSDDRIDSFVMSSYFFLSDDITGFEMFDLDEVEL